jgi:hypothetical protein
MRRSVVFGAAVLLAAALSSAPASAGRLLLSWTPPGIDAPEPRASWTYSGCWSPRTGAPCVDIYRDANGDAWQCKACGTTRNPGPGKCTRVSETQLQNGRRCS